MTKINGRINILDSTIKDPNYLAEKIQPNENSSYDEALRGNIECSTLSKAYFSKENMQIVQNAIRAGVYEKSNKQYIIGQQDIVSLKIIMRAIFLQYSRNIQNNITKEIEFINNIVVQHCVPKIMSEAKAYIKYKHDASTLVQPLDNPIHSAYKNKTNEFKRFI